MSKRQITFITALSIYGLGFVLLYLERLFLGPLFIIGGLSIIPIAIMMQN